MHRSAALFPPGVKEQLMPSHPQPLRSKDLRRAFGEMPGTVQLMALESCS